MKRLSRILIACTVAGGLVLAPFAQAAEPDASTVSKLMIRVLGYDRSLSVKDRDALVVAVIQAPGDDKDSLVTALGRQRLYGKKVRVVEVEYAGPTELNQRLMEADPHAVYVGPGLDKSVGLIVGIARARSIRTFTGTENYVRQGVGVGIVTRRGRPQVLVNLSASKADGAQLDANLLRFAEVLR